MFLSYRHGFAVIGSAILLISLFGSAAAVKVPRRMRHFHKHVQLEKDGAAHQEDPLANGGSKSSNRAAGSRAVIETQVLILGAGMAGISAGKVLSGLGVNFIILEGKDRMGGRILDGKLGTNTVEYGANWLHDIETNVLWQYAQKIGLTGSFDTLNDLIVRSADGSDVTVSARVLINKFEETVDALLRIYFARCVPWCDLSVHEALTLAGWSSPVTELERAVELYMFDWSEVLSTKEISFYGFIQGYLVPDNEYEVVDFLVTDPRGFAFLVRSLASEYLRANDPRLLYNEVVTTIDYRRTETNKVLVTTSSGNVYAAEHVIVTFSNNVITYGDVQFLPALPDSKLTALRHMPTSIYTKHFIDLSRQILDERLYILLAHEGNNWRKNALWQNLAKLPQFSRTGAALVTNLAADGYNSSLLSPTEAIDFIVNSVTKIYPIIKTIDKSRMAETHYNWADDRFARGSFATPKVGLTVQMIEDLAASVAGVVHFAGDGTSIADYGSITAAFVNGQNVALQVVIALD